METGTSISKSEHYIIADAVNCLFMVLSKLPNPGFIIEGCCCRYLLIIVIALLNQRILSGFYTFLKMPVAVSANHQNIGTKYVERSCIRTFESFPPQLMAPGKVCYPLSVHYQRWRQETCHTSRDSWWATSASPLTGASSTSTRGRCRTSTTERRALRTTRPTTSWWTSSLS